jgi:hypothetical protein
MTQYHIPLDGNILVQKCGTYFSHHPPNAVATTLLRHSLKIKQIWLIWWAVLK